MLCLVIPLISYNEQNNSELINYYYLINCFFNLLVNVRYRRSTFLLFFLNTLGESLAESGIQLVVVFLIVILKSNQKVPKMQEKSVIWPRVVVKVP